MGKGGDRQRRRACWQESVRDGRREHYPYQVITSKAEVLDTVGKWAQAEELYRSQLQWARNAGLPGCEAASLNALGWMHHQRGEDDKARELISRALSIYTDLNDVGGLAQAHSQLGGAHFQIGEYPEALGHYRRAQELSKQLGDLQSEAKAMNNIGNILGEQGDDPGALALYQRVLEVSLKSGNVFMEAVVSGNIGASQLSAREYGRALEMFSRQLELGGRLGHKLLMSAAYGSLAGVHLKMGELDRALEYISQRIRMAEETGDIKGQAMAWDYLGNVHYTKGEHGPAEGAFLKAVQLGRRANIKFFLCSFLQNLACLYLDTDRPSQAAEANGQALELAGEMGLPEAAFVSRRIAAKILALSDPQAAANALKDLLPQAGDKEREAEVLASLFEVTGDDDSRLAALKLYRELNGKTPTAEYGQTILRLERAKK